jgi:hypothetical protein
MPRIRCYYVDCVFIDEGYCGAAAVEFDPDVGCMTFSRASDVAEKDEWVDEEEEELEDWEDLEDEDEDEEDWLDEDEF